MTTNPRTHYATGCVFVARNAISGTGSIGVLFNRFSSLIHSTIAARIDLVDLNHRT